MNHVIYLDEKKEQVQIFGITYDLDFFRQFSLVGRTLKIIKKEDGVVTVQNVPDTQWRTEPPTEPGWYWIAPADGGESVVRRVHIETEITRPSLCVEVNDGQEDYVMMNVYSQRARAWLGPLPVPEMPK